jgi:hypothetical protein
VWFVLIPLILAMISSPALAHQAPAGWTYPAECCSSFDCYEVKDGVVEEVPGGYHVTTNNETIPQTSPKVKNSLDGHYHLCTAGGKPEGRTFCILVPPRGF